MSGPDPIIPLASAENSQEAFETAVEVLSGLREGNLNPAFQRDQTSQDYSRGRLTFSSSAHLVPRTEEELAYDRCKKLPVKTSIADVREELGIPSTGMANDHTWDQLSVNPSSSSTHTSHLTPFHSLKNVVAQLGDEYHLETKDSTAVSIKDLTNICKSIEQSIPWQDCAPKQPAAAFVPVLLYRWKKNRIRRPEQRKGLLH
ncbi:hypothetical protein TWF788_008260 [Orbilia oligospora]|uniref:Uncharacterized protein n=1 Tax=Orbilia oligospora TaxID=2813651 RepID=A0A7C8Q2Q4_ORBOL|nr:hypothetical protein TWF788_008260 [Orbilia oligospora]